LTLCHELPPQGGGIDVVDERALPVDLDDGQPFAVPRFEVRVAGDVDRAVRRAGVVQHAARPLAEVTALRVVEDDVVYG
jgi:hypothetical protein